MVEHGTDGDENFYFTVYGLEKEKYLYVLIHVCNSTYAYVNIVRRRESGVAFTLAYKILGCGIEKINELICLRLFENSVNEVLHFWNDSFTTK